MESMKSPWRVHEHLVQSAHGLLMECSWTAHGLLMESMGTRGKCPHPLSFQLVTIVRFDPCLSPQSPSTRIDNIMVVKHQLPQNLPNLFPHEKLTCFDKTVRVASYNTIGLCSQCLPPTNTRSPPQTVHSVQNPELFTEFRQVAHPASTSLCERKPNRDANALSASQRPTVVEYQHAPKLLT